MGRETAIQEVYWTSDDWLRLKDNQTTPMEEIMIETNEEVQQERDHQFMDTFEGELKRTGMPDVFCQGLIGVIQKLDLVFTTDCR